jgi:DNA-binding IclR family transcriptional regulator
VTQNPSSLGDLLNTLMDANLTAHQMRLLCLLRLNGGKGMTPSEVMERLGVHASTFYRSLAGLAALGLVERHHEATTYRVSPDLLPQALLPDFESK